MRHRHIRTILTAVTAAVLAAVSLVACVEKIDFPGRFGYRVHVSDDFLRLFDIRADYVDADGELQSEYVGADGWLRDFMKKSDLDAEITLLLIAKDETIRGVNLVKPSYSFDLSAEVYNDKSLVGNTKTKTKSLSDSDTGNLTFSFKVPLNGVDPDKVKAAVAPLKFDKHFAFCFTVDGSSVNGWSQIFSRINGMWIDGKEFCHKNSYKSDGYFPEGPLTVTDGCGNLRRFSFGEGLAPNGGNEKNPDGFILDEVSSVHAPYISWEELEIIADMGNGLYFNEVDEREWDTSKSGDIVAGLEEDWQRTFEKTGYPMKTLVIAETPDTYLEAAKKSPYVSLVRDYISDDIFPGTCQSLHKKTIFGGDKSFDTADKLEELAEQSSAKTPKLISMYAHRPQDKYIDLFESIYELYGKDGLDNIWVTSYDELYEYVERRNNAVISSYVSEGYKIFEVTVPYEERFIYEEMSFIVSGASSPALPESDNLYGFSSAPRNGGVLVNCTFTDRNLRLAEKYTELFELTQDTDYKACADYLTSLLREDLRSSLSSRSAKVHVPTQEEMPMAGTYFKADIPQYVKLYNGYTFTLRKRTDEK